MKLETVTGSLLLPAVKNRIDVPTLLERLFGETEFRGQLTFCPFHSHGRNTPSFHVFEDDARWRCYSCHRNGDVIDFWQAAFFVRTGRKLFFDAAVRSLALFAGVVTSSEISPAHVMGMALALREAAAGKADPLRDRVRKLADERVEPLILAVRTCGTSGAFEKAEFLAEQLDLTLGRAFVPVSEIVRQIQGLERIARDFLAEAEALAEEKFETVT